MGNTLADQLCALPDDGLAALLALRPDLVVPVPADLSALAARAQTRVSAARALDPLDRFTLEVLDALRVSRAGPGAVLPDGIVRHHSDEDAGATSVEAVLALFAAGRDAPPPAAVRTAIDRLRARFLVYGPESALRVAAGVDEACPPYPAGLGRPATELSA
ncbi:MAG TPA: hypothetical protein VJT31_40875, partial [Rugosimonospora sp.]|nr:hypothetical protein [Rugosimonospora sp.]